LESYEERHVAAIVFIELTAMQPADERFVAKTTVHIKNVAHHSKEEEVGRLLRAFAATFQRPSVPEGVTGARGRDPCCAVRNTAHRLDLGPKPSHPHRPAHHRLPSCHAATVVHGAEGVAASDVWAALAMAVTPWAPLASPGRS
jgi:hypothetical protein